MCRHSGAGYNLINLLLKRMTRVDGLFHAALGATVLFGFAMAGSLADELWERRNQGVGLLLSLLASSRQSALCQRSNTIWTAEAFQTHQVAK